MTFIYALIDPETSETRYVGKTNNPNRRIKDHYEDKGPEHKCRWIQSLIRRGLRPEMEMLEALQDEGDWSNAERFWIEYFRFIGARLTNFTIGGEGAIPNAEYKKLMSVRAKQRLLDRPELLAQVIGIGKANAKPLPAGMKRKRRVLPSGKKTIDRGEYRKCEYCKDKFFAREGNLKRGWGRFCSPECRSRGCLSGPNNPAWRGGKWALTEKQKEYKRKWNKQARLKKKIARAENAAPEMLEIIKRK